jgi:hypothetical protein
MNEIKEFVRLGMPCRSSLFPCVVPPVLDAATKMPTRAALDSQYLEVAHA